MEWFKKKKKTPTIEQRLDQLEHQLTAEKNDKLQVESKLQEAEEELLILREKQLEYEDKQNSSEPWVEVIGSSIDPVKGIEIKLDWNNSFIVYLTENGITGDNEDVIVQKWLALLYQGLIEKFEQKIVDTNTNKTISDYI